MSTRFTLREAAGDDRFDHGRLGVGVVLHEFPVAAPTVMARNSST
jgi:hypothetical protein